MRNAIAGITIGVIFGSMFACVHYMDAPTPPHNLAVDFTAQFVPQLSPTAKCTPWTGHGTSIPGVDSVLCREATAILYCSAPTDHAPKCEAAIDWTPKAPTTQPAIHDPAPAPATPIEPSTAKVVREATKKPELKKP